MGEQGSQPSGLIPAEPGPDRLPLLGVGKGLPGDLSQALAIGDQQDGVCALPHTGQPMPVPGPLEFGPLGVV